jgi:hypothetical protein
MMGFVDVYPAINTVSSATEHVIGKLAARNCWDYTNGSLLVAEELARPGSGPTGARFWALRLGSDCSLYSISVSAKPAPWSLAASVDILLLIADLRKVGQGETKDFSALLPQPETKSFTFSILLSSVDSLGN